MSFEMNMVEYDLGSRLDLNGSGKFNAFRDPSSSNFGRLTVASNSRVVISLRLTYFLTNGPSGSC
jgi:hypothetical protein